MRDEFSLVALEHAWDAPAMTSGGKLLVQVYCRVEVVVDNPTRVAELAVQALRDSDIDWSSEQDTLEEAVTEIRNDVTQALASLVEPDRMLDGIPGVEMRGGRWWAELGAPSERFQPGFDASG